MCKCSSMKIAINAIHNSKNFIHICHTHSAVIDRFHGLFPVFSSVNSQCKTFLHKTITMNYLLIVNSLVE